MTELLSWHFEAAVLLLMLLFISVLAAGAYLTIPRSLRHLALSRAFRFDGSYSPRRHRIERWHLVKFVGEALCGPLLVALPVVLIGFVVHQWVVPFGLAVETLGAFHWDADLWRERVEATARSSHSSWAEAQGYDKERILALQRMVWTGWPVIALALLLAALASIAAAARYLQRLVARYQRDLEERCLEYRLTDASRLAAGMRDMETVQFAPPDVVDNVPRDQGL
jgi:hypothetical protein